jgi:peptide-methionine (R)-S-oxide reductase
MAAISGSAKADVPAGRDPFDYEVTRTEEEWRALLGDAYPILREGKTERQRSSPLWAEARQGRYDCKGCDLTQYSSFTKVNLLKGWLFFTASEPNAQLMSQDGPAEMSDAPSAFDVTIEVHCRRCGSHMGHVLLVEGNVLHCINGASLNFIEASA